jgi:hypothetical protein
MALGPDRQLLSSSDPPWTTTRWWFKGDELKTHINWQFDISDMQVLRLWFSERIDPGTPQRRKLRMLDADIMEIEGRRLSKRANDVQMEVIQSLQKQALPLPRQIEAISVPKTD